MSELPGMSVAAWTSIGSGGTMTTDEVVLNASVGGTSVGGSPAQRPAAVSDNIRSIRTNKIRIT